MEGPYEKTKKTMETVYREAVPNQDLDHLKSYTSKPWVEVALKLKQKQRNGLCLNLCYKQIIFLISTGFFFQSTTFIR